MTSPEWRSDAYMAIVHICYCSSYSNSINCTLIISDGMMVVMVMVTRRNCHGVWEPPPGGRRR